MTSFLLGFLFLMGFTVSCPEASARLRWRFTVETEQPTRAAMVDNDWFGLAWRSLWISAWSKLRPEETPAKMSRSSGVTVTSRRLRISRRWDSVVPATKPATSCETTASARHSARSGHSPQRLAARAMSAACARRSAAVPTLAASSSSSGSWNSEANFTHGVASSSAMVTVDPPCPWGSGLFNSCYTRVTDRGEGNKGFR